MEYDYRETCVHEEGDTMKWKNLKGYEGIYRVNEIGDIESIHRKELSRNKFGSMVRSRGGIYLKPFVNCNNEYLMVELNKNCVAKKIAIHRIVYESFVGELIKGMVIHHIDGNKINNHYKNLVQITYKEHNNIHKHEAWNKNIKSSPEHIFNATKKRKENYLVVCEETFNIKKQNKSNKLTAVILNISERQVQDRIKTYKEFINEKNCS